MISEQNKFVIWGTGSRSEVLTEVINTDRIVAYIDNDKDRQGSFFYGKRIISLEDYKTYYSDKFIVVTPIYAENEIIEQLKKNNINKVFRLSYCPSEMQGYGIKDFWKYLRKMFSDDKNNVIYGDNVYSILAYEYCKRIHPDNTYLCLGKDEETHNIIRKHLIFDEIREDDINTKDSEIFLSTRKAGASELKSANDSNIVDIYDLSEIIPEYYYPKNKTIRNSQSGKRCFIVATGPSLRIDDLKKLSEKSEKCFGVNKIFNIDYDVWKPDYYVFSDRQGALDFQNEIARYDIKTKFLIDTYSREEPITGEVFPLHVVAGDEYDELPKFSDDIARRVYGHATVTYVTIQIAVYMGFKYLYLLGVDCSYKKGSRNNYFFQESTPDNRDRNIDRMVLCYEAAKQYADSHGIKIYNATRGGKLEVFERVDFDSLFED